MYTKCIRHMLSCAASWERRRYSANLHSGPTVFLTMAYTETNTLSSIVPTLFNFLSDTYQERIKK